MAKYSFTYGNNKRGTKKRRVETRQSSMLHWKSSVINDASDGYRVRVKKNKQGKVQSYSAVNDNGDFFVARLISKKKK